MKYIMVLFITGFLLCCKKEIQTFIPPPADASNKIEGDIVWGGITSTHFINQPQDVYGDHHAFFVLDTPVINSNYGISITGNSNDTFISISILNPNLHVPGVYHFQDLDSNHYVEINLQADSVLGSLSMLLFTGISWSNAGQLTIDSISENHISGSIDTYCNRQNLVTNIPDTNEVHLIFHFSGDLRRG